MSSDSTATSVSSYLFGSDQQTTNTEPSFSSLPDLSAYSLSSSSVAPSASTSMTSNYAQALPPLLPTPDPDITVEGSDEDMPFDEAKSDDITLSQNQSFDNQELRSIERTDFDGREVARDGYAKMASCTERVSPNLSSVGLARNFGIPRTGVADGAIVDSNKDERFSDEETDFGPGTLSRSSTSNMAKASQQTSAPSTSQSTAISRQLRRQRQGPGAFESISRPIGLTAPTRGGNEVSGLQLAPPLHVSDRDGDFDRNGDIEHFCYGSGGSPRSLENSSSYSPSLLGSTTSELIAATLVQDSHNLRMDTGDENDASRSNHRISMSLTGSTRGDDDCAPIVYANSVKYDYAKRNWYLALCCGIGAVIILVTFSIALATVKRNASDSLRANVNPRCFLPLEEQSVLDHCRCFNSTRRFTLSNDEEYFLNNTLVRLLEEYQIMPAEDIEQLRSDHSCDARHQAMLWESNFGRLNRTYAEVQQVPLPYIVQLMVLAVFYISTGGAEDAWEMDDGWLDHYSFCYWFGVE